MYKDILLPNKNKVYLFEISNNILYIYNVINNKAMILTVEYDSLPFECEGHYNKPEPETNTDPGHWGFFELLEVKYNGEDFTDIISNEVWSELERQCLNQCQ